MIVETRAVGSFAMNMYVVACPESRRAAIIDSGGELDWAQEVLESYEADVDFLLQTHSHIDHVTELAQAKRRWPSAAVVLHPLDLPIYEGSANWGERLGISIEALPEVDRFVEDGEEIQVGSLNFEVFFTPGHAPGHVCYLETTKRVIFSGDLLFEGSIGRTDFPGCSRKDMKKSLVRAMALDDDFRVLCGHGPETTIGQERRSNPFIRGLRSDMD
jgi:glyoxylase-like metal-dependent hydrolase (beta-lactamase superfamily II)